MWVQSLFKQKGPNGLGYFGSLTLPFESSFLQINLSSFDVQGGAREAVVMNEMLGSGQVKLENQRLVNWSCDPYNPSQTGGLLMNLAEDPALDSKFEDSALTVARRNLGQLKHELALKPSVSNLAPYKVDPIFYVPKSLKHGRQLFYLNTKDIAIAISLGFDGENLKLDGQDLGERVLRLMGDWDYEYTITVLGHDLTRLYQIGGLQEGDKQALVDYLVPQLSSDRAFSLFKEFLSGNGIEHELFTYA